MRLVKVAAAAEQDLQEILNHVSQQNPSAASKLIKEIVGKFAILRDHPYSGTRKIDCLSTCAALWSETISFFTNRSTIEWRFYECYTVHEILRISSKAF
jgi:plasmid stabilization system protein ParE